MNVEKPGTPGTRDRSLIYLAVPILVAIRYRAALVALRLKESLPDDCYSFTCTLPDLERRLVAVHPVI